MKGRGKRGTRTRRGRRRGGRRKCKCQHRGLLLRCLGRTGAQLPQPLCLRRSLDQLERRGGTVRCEHLGCWIMRDERNIVTGGRQHHILQCRLRGGGASAVCSEQPRPEALLTRQPGLASRGDTAKTARSTCRSTSAAPSIAAVIETSPVPAPTSTTLLPASGPREARACAAVRAPGQSTPPHRCERSLSTSQPSIPVGSPTSKILTGDTRPGMSTVRTRKSMEAATAQTRSSTSSVRILSKARASEAAATSSGATRTVLPTSSRPAPSSATIATRPAFVAPVAARTSSPEPHARISRAAKETRQATIIGPTRCARSSVSLDDQIALCGEEITSQCI